MAALDLGSLGRLAFGAFSASDRPDSPPSSPPSPSASVAALLTPEPIYTACYCEENVYQLCVRLLALEMEGSGGTGGTGGTGGATGLTGYAVFISNRQKVVPVWCQRSAHSADAPVLWDYHVVLMVQGEQKVSGGGAAIVSPKKKHHHRNHRRHRHHHHDRHRRHHHQDGGERETWILDLDTTLPNPCPFDEYYEGSFQPEENIKSAFRQRLRVVSAATFVEHFASDRSHMRLTSASGEPTGEWSSPPPSYECIRGEQAASTMNLSEWMSMDLPGDPATGDRGDGDDASDDDAAGSGSGGGSEGGGGGGGGAKEPAVRSDGAGDWAGADGGLGGPRGRVYDLAEFGRVFGCGGSVL